VAEATEESTGRGESVREEIGEGTEGVWLTTLQTGHHLTHVYHREVEQTCHIAHPHPLHHLRTQVPVRQVQCTDCRGGAVRDGQCKSTGVQEYKRERFHESSREYKSE
jgi:hypothetical protein